MPDPRLGLTLSGGGFRATLFHLGVVRLLRDGGLLRKVRRIGAVSGGSVLAAHLVLNWDRYTGSIEEFEAAANEVIDFTEKDIRGRVVRRWILAWLLVLPRLFTPRRWTFTNLLQGYYARLYRNATLADLRPPEGVDRPQPFFYCTSLSTGVVCSFGRSGFMWDSQDEEHAIIAPGTPVALAVAASSAFPPLFPPIEISNEMLSCDVKEFPHPQYITDGGVYDNLGIDRMMWYHGIAKDLDRFIISDAEGNFDWTLGHKYTFITGRNIRASDLLMKRVSTLKYETLASRGDELIVVDIDAVTLDAGNPAVLLPEIQRGLRNIRTDLDAFSLDEIACLVQHGYAVARASLVENELLPREGPRLDWDPTSGRLKAKPSAKAIRRARERRIRLWSFSDWASWATLAWLLCVTLLPTGLFVVKQRRLTEQAAAAGNLKAVNDRLNDLAKTYYRGRHRPIAPGTSVGHVRETAESICCFAKPRDGSAERYVIGSWGLMPPGAKVGDAILQPGPHDGGRQTNDVIAHLSRVVRPTAANAALAAMGKLVPGISFTNQVTGLGPIRGPADPLVPGQEVFVAGRTSGISRAIVSVIELDNVVVEVEGERIRFDGLIGLRAMAGTTALSGGDDGAPVLTADGRLAAMIFATSEQESYAIPIQSILDALGVDLDVAEGTR
jgi:predicted acylesterase/phospholipase RssA